MKANQFDELNTSARTKPMPATTNFLRLARLACLVGGTFALSTAAWGQSSDGTVPDAQVEANVLKALASAPELAGEDIHTHTVYGVVSLTGRVRTGVLQTRAENLAADANGVKKVVDELQVDATTQAAANIPAAEPAASAQAATTPGTTAHPAPGSAPASTAVMNDPEHDQQQNLPTNSSQQGQTTAGQPSVQPPYGQRQPYGNPPPQPGYGGRSTQGDPGYAGAPEYGQYPGNQHGQGQASGRYPDDGDSDGRTGYRQQPVYGGQQAGKSVVVADGTMIRVRLNQTVSSDRSTPGSRFDGTVESDVIADDAVAIPRGAQVSGTVVEATKAGALKGRGDLTIALDSVTLGGRVFPLVTKPWSHHGGDKTIETVNKTAGFGAAGALIGALAGGGEGAAVGGGIGAAAGLGSSATSGRGQVYIPAEGVVTFRLAKEASVTTVSEQEMQRLAYGAAPPPPPRYPRRRCPPVYIAPVYYPGYYPGYYRPFPGYYPGPYGYPPY